MAGYIAVTDPVGKIGRKIVSMLYTALPSVFHRYLDFSSLNILFPCGKLGFLFQCF